MPGAAAECRVINNLVRPLPVITEIVQVQLNDSASQSPPDDALPQRARKETGKESDDVNLHRSGYACWVGCSSVRGWLSTSRT